MRASRRARRSVFGLRADASPPLNRLVHAGIEQHRIANFTAKLR
jgi:hypothetical protein